MKETTLYVCEICGERYTSITEAENCEELIEAWMPLPKPYREERTEEWTI